MQVGLSTFLILVQWAQNLPNTWICGRNSPYFNNSADGIYAISSRAFHQLQGVNRRWARETARSFQFAFCRQTVQRYLSAFVETFMIEQYVPFFRNARQEIVKSCKIYFTDAGIRNLALERFSPLDNASDRGFIFENVVASELQ